MADSDQLPKGEDPAKVRMVVAYAILDHFFVHVGTVVNVITYSYARNSLKAVLDAVVRDVDVTIISRRDAEGDAVIMSLDHYNSLMETLYLLSTPANAQALARAVEQDRADQAQPRTLIDVDGD